MNILRRKPKGFIKTIALIIIAILALFYFGIDANALVDKFGNFLKTVIDLITQFVKAVAQMIREALA